MSPGKRTPGRWHRTLMACLLLGGGGATGAWALEPGLDIGLSSEQSPTLALGLHHAFSAPPWLPAAFAPWSLQVSTRFLLLPGRNREASSAALILAPALRYTLPSGSFIEGGIGAALFLDAHLRDGELGTAGQFEDRLAVGWRLAGGTLQLALAHFSNASLKPPNDGLEILSLGYRWRL